MDANTKLRPDSEHGSLADKGPVQGSMPGGGPTHGSILGKDAGQGSLAGNGPNQGNKQGGGPMQGSMPDKGAEQGSLAGNGPVQGPLDLAPTPVRDVPLSRSAQMPLKMPAGAYQQTLIPPVHMMGGPETLPPVTEGARVQKVKQVRRRRKWRKSKTQMCQTMGGDYCTRGTLFVPCSVGRLHRVVGCGCDCDCDEDGMMKRNGFDCACCAQHIVTLLSILPPIACALTWYLRGRVRRAGRFKEGGFCQDMIDVLLCFPCVQCQLAEETENGGTSLAKGRDGELNVQVTSSGGGKKEDEYGNRDGSGNKNENNDSGCCDCDCDCSCGDCCDFDCGGCGDCCDSILSCLACDGCDD